VPCGLTVAFFAALSFEHMFQICFSTVLPALFSFCLRLLRAYLPKSEDGGYGVGGYGAVYGGQMQQQEQQQQQGSGSGVGGYTSDFTVANKREQTLIVEEGLDEFDATQGRLLLLLLLVIHEGMVSSEK
jgi:hypothetical protein